MTTKEVQDGLLKIFEPFGWIDSPLHKSDDWHEYLLACYKDIPEGHKTLFLRALDADEEKAYGRGKLLLTMYKSVGKRLNRIVDKHSVMRNVIEMERILDH